MPRHRRIAARQAAAVARDTPKPQRDTREPFGFEDSSWLRRAWFDEEAGSIEVEFTDNARWIYFTASRQTWESLTSAGSPGGFVRNVLSGFPGHRTR